MESYRCKIGFGLKQVTNMRHAKEFRAAREAFRRDQQSWTFFDPLIIFVIGENFFVFNRFHSMTQSCAARLLNGNWQSGLQ